MSLKWKMGSESRTCAWGVCVRVGGKGEGTITLKPTIMNLPVKSIKLMIHT